MQLRMIANIIFFISAYSPLLIILAVKDFDFDNVHCFKHPISVAILLSLAIASNILLLVAMKKIKPGNFIVIVTGIKNRTEDIINYTIPYILSFFSFDLSKWADIISISIFLLIMLLLTIRSNSIFLNPILAIFGYGLFDIDYKHDGTVYSTIVMSKHELIVNKQYNMRSLTRFLYLVTERNKE